MEFKGTEPVPAAHVKRLYERSFRNLGDVFMHYSICGTRGEIDLDELGVLASDFVGWLYSPLLMPPEAYAFRYSGDLNRLLEDGKRVKLLCDHMKAGLPENRTVSDLVPRTVAYNEDTRALADALRPLLDDLMTLKPAREISWPGAPQVSSPALAGDPPALFLLHMNQFGMHENLQYVVYRAALENKHLNWVYNLRATTSLLVAPYAQALHDTGYLLDYFGRLSLWYKGKPFRIDDIVVALTPRMDDALKATLRQACRCYAAFVEQPELRELLGLSEPRVDNIELAVA